MKFVSRTTLFAVGSLLLAACTVEEKGPPPAAPGTPGAAAPQAPAPDAAPELPAIHSQAEADAKAAATISKENADLELEKLKKELGGG